MREIIAKTLKLLRKESENQANIGTNCPTDIEDVQVVGIPEEAGIWDKMYPSLINITNQQTQFKCKIKQNMIQIQ